MTEPIFFEIPIYRCSREAHSKYMEEQILSIDRAIPKALYPESNRISQDHFHSSLWYGWKYNEIVGYLGLYILGSQFRADIWLVEKRRFNRGITKKKFKYYGKTFEKQIPRNKSTAEIFTFIVNQLEYVNKKHFKRRYFDLKTFKVIGRFVDWKSLIEQLNSYSYPDFRREYFEDTF